jgi:hypothetical protein
MFFGWGDGGSKWFCQSLFDGLFESPQRLFQCSQQNRLKSTTTSIAVGPTPSIAVQPALSIAVQPTPSITVQPTPQESTRVVLY